MQRDGFKFDLLHVDRKTGARRSRLSTPRGVIEMPTFMPVGTNATVKGLTPSMVADSGAQILLGNTYHLSLRPGEEVVKSLGGLHKFMDWQRPILTDSGGFQVFSLAKINKVTEESAIFQSHIDGSRIELSPERSIEIQEALGSDIAMVMDHVVALPSEATLIEEACHRSLRWAKRSRDRASRQDQVLFGIVQGGLDPKLRRLSAEGLVDLDFFGYAIGGLSVGEPPKQMYAALDVTNPHLPTDRPRYLMGVGAPADLLESVSRGVDMFDCVMPTRNGRNALAFTDEGRLRLRNKKFQLDRSPLMPGMKSGAGRFSRGYIRHLFMAGEMLGPILLSLHNLAYYQELMKGARDAIEADSFEEYQTEKMAGWGIG